MKQLMSVKVEFLDFGSNIKKLPGHGACTHSWREQPAAILDAQIGLVHAYCALPYGTWRLRERCDVRGTFGIWLFATIAMHSYCECLLQCTVFVNVYRKTCPLISPGFQEDRPRQHFFRGSRPIGILCIACSQWHRRYCCRSLRRCIAYILRAGCIETSSLRTLRWTVHVWRRWILQKIEGKSQETNPKFYFPIIHFSGGVVNFTEGSRPRFFWYGHGIHISRCVLLMVQKVRHVRETS